VDEVVDEEATETPTVAQVEDAVAESPAAAEADPGTASEAPTAAADETNAPTSTESNAGRNYGGGNDNDEQSGGMMKWLFFLVMIGGGLGYYVKTRMFFGMPPGGQIGTSGKYQQIDMNVIESRRAVE